MSIAANDSGVVVGGTLYKGTADFDPDSSHPNNSDILQTIVGRDGFVLRLGPDGVSNPYEWVHPIGLYVGIVDDGGPGYTETGSGWHAGPPGYGDDSRAQDQLNSSNAATWTLSTPPGSYDVYVTWAASSANTTAASYRLNGVGLRTL